ncbi:type IV toxin-antitoxin system AbiEi family antitoxin domain-containing protein [Sulfitobacter sp. R18_1]|uniref:type IV toxin-antitoxin system AbiEi family antitoxin domain-containing protein n=1 Tax=Sulfitobacter sp. R18_1 TaxID=2821104 RepID=UPI001AD9CB43|nr:type IV toxin-antitoxin system AbiEi family antitoxin domain-containing protein [Sulfitobacter sp. R18_1]MBO9428363.1 type IV toxin-antitoxin system AbiEi family antitoxin domain-containing protein [Sulfitobacter sp. R18_1]
MLKRDLLADSQAQIEVIMGPKMRDAVKVMKSGRFFSTAALDEAGIDRRVLKRLEKQEIVHTLIRGVYYLDEKYVKESNYPPHPNFETFSLGLKNGGDTAFVHLYSAASFHELNVDGNVQYVTLGLDRDRGLPAGDDFKYRRLSEGPKTNLGVEVYGEHRGVPIRITNLERTVVDLVYYSPLNGRSDVDEETAVDALNRYACHPDKNPALLDKMAREFGVENAVRIAMKNSSRSIEDEGVTLKF